MKLSKKLTTVTPLSKYLAMALFIIFPFASFFLGVQYQKSVTTVGDISTTTPTPSPQLVIFPSGTPNELVQLYKNTSNEIKAYVSGPQIVKRDTWWVTPDGWSILVPTDKSMVIKVLPSGSAEPNKEEFGRLNTIARDIMLSSKFTLNTLNSSESESDKKYYDYVQAYEKGNEKCVATSSPDVGAGANEDRFYSKFTFSCFTNEELQAAYDLQIPFLKGLNRKNSVVSLIEVKGDRATMGIHGRRTGAVAFMYKSGSEWKTVIIAQAVPGCDELIANGVPQEFWVDCYDSNNKIRKGGFNQ